jgi:hypothetical protein
MTAAVEALNYIYLWFTYLNSLNHDYALTAAAQREDPEHGLTFAWFCFLTDSDFKILILYHIKNRLAILASAKFVPQAFLLYHGVVVFILKGELF